jgi:hypothetical protein
MTIEVDRIIRSNSEGTMAEIEAVFDDEDGLLEFYSVRQLIGALKEYRALYAADHVFLRLLPVEHTDTGEIRHLVFLADTRDGRTGVTVTPRERDAFEWYPNWSEQSSLTPVENDDPPLEDSESDTDDAEA